jgi:hypothetical protein
MLANTQGQEPLRMLFNDDIYTIRRVLMQKTSSVTQAITNCFSGMAMLAMHDTVVVGDEVQACLQASRELTEDRVMTIEESQFFENAEKLPFSPLPVEKTRILPMRQR